MAVKFLSGEEVKKEVAKGGLAVVNFYATWCGPCKMFAPILEEESGKYNVMKIDVDKDQDFAKEMGVSGIPATFIFKDSKVVNSLSGYLPKEVLDEALESARQ